MRLIVLGTGTGVGKTWLTRDLAIGLKELDWSVLALKPIETGFPLQDDQSPTPGSDAATLEAATFHVEHPRPHPRYALREGLSPHLAAELDRQTITLEAVTTWLSDAERVLPSARSVTLIETAGGVFSPLSTVTRNYDLGLALRADLWLLVAPDRLGVLHDVAATLEAMSARGRSPDGIAILPPSRDDASTGSNVRELQRLHGTLPVFSHTPSASSAPRSSAVTPGPPPGLLAWLTARLRA
jgi:dethiobiotin synthetase